MLGQRTGVFTFWASLVASVVNGLEAQIPSVASFTPSNIAGSFTLLPTTQIIVDSRFQHQGSPSLTDYARTFQSDLVHVTGFKTLPAITTASSANNQHSSIFLTLNPQLNLTYFSGKSAGEGYAFNISTPSYVIQGVDAIGVWWGTRTLLQQAALSSGKTFSIPGGSGEDSPGWPIRGFMLDAGRHYFEPSFLGDLCSYASFFKINEFHIHTSDNLWDPNFLYTANWRELYSGFRFAPNPEGPNAGLVPNANESWSKESFQSMQSHCLSYGVTLVPEIDTPGHSLGIVKWKPDLMIAGAPDSLNLSHPETIPTVKGIWQEFLPWFTSSEVSIGADEYDSSLADEYISFVNEMSAFIQSESKKNIRVWGTYEPSSTMSIVKNVTIQHWDFPDSSIPAQLFDQGYSVINSEQYFLYLDGKTSDGGQFPQTLDLDLIWGGAPGGGGWAPNIFSPSDSSNNTDAGNPLLRGAIMALWSDWGNNSTTPLEDYYQLSQSLAAFGEKAWSGGEAARTSALTQKEFNTAYPTLNTKAPGQNLNRIVTPAHGSVVFNYSHLGSLPVHTSFQSVGPPYTLRFTVTPPSKGLSAGTLFSGTDTALLLHDLSFVDLSTNVTYPLLSNYNISLPSNKATAVEIHATREYTFALVDGGSRRLYYTTDLDIWGEYMLTQNMSFAAPAETIGNGFAGRLEDITLSLGA